MTMTSNADLSSAQILQLNDLISNNLDLALYQTSKTPTNLSALVYKRNRLIIDRYQKDIEKNINFYEKHKARLGMAICAMGIAIFSINFFILTYFILPKIETRPPYLDPKGIIFVGLTELGVPLAFFYNRILDAVMSYYQKRLFKPYQDQFFSFHYQGLLEDPCVICLDNLRKNQALTGHIANGSVAHLFHQECMDKFINTQVKEIGKRHFISCPCCKQTIIKAKFTVS